MKAYIKFPLESLETSIHRSRQLWGDGRVLQSLLVNEAGTDSDEVSVARWFGQPAWLVGCVEEEEKQSTDARVIDGQQWLARCIGRLSKSVERTSTEVIDALGGNFGVLLVGATGAGKTVLLNAIAECKFLKADICIIIGGMGLREMVKAVDNCKGIVLIDDIDRAILKGRTSSSSSREETLLIRALHRARNRNVMLLASTSRMDCVQKSFLHFHCFDRIVRLLAPSFEERKQQLVQYSLDLETVEWIAKRCSGWSRAELNAFARQIVECKDKSRWNTLYATILKSASIYRGSGVVPPTFDDDDIDSIAAGDEIFNAPHLGGLFQVRSILHHFIVSFFNSEGKGIRGIILYGSPGNGKTMLGTAFGQYIQQKGHANFLCIRCLDLVSKVVGETERNISNVFAKAKDCAPCLLFLDQIESIAPKPSSESETTERTFERVLSVFLVELDGVLTKDFQNKVVVMAATSRLENLAPAIIRPGRLGTHISVDPPDTIFEKVQVLKACTNSMSLNVSEHFFETFSQQYLNNKSRADISNIAREAAILALRENIANEAVEEKHFIQACKD